MKLDKHYIDEKELWKVTIELEDNQIRSEKVRYLVYYPSLCQLFILLDSDLCTVYTFVYQ